MGGGASSGGGRFRCWRSGTDRRGKCTWRGSPEEIRKARELTDKPIGVNVMLLSPHADDVARVVVEEGIKVVTTGAGNPEKYMDMWKAAALR